MTQSVDHKKYSTVDVLFLLAELEHMRRHCVLAAVVADEEEAFQHLILAKSCQEQRRELQSKYFPKVKEHNWCIIKSAARLLQLTEEITNGDIKELKDLKNIVNEAISLTTGEDISFCEACRADAQDEKILHIK